MSVPRLLLSCSIALVTAHCLRAEPTPVSQGAEKNGRNAPGESNITFNSVHVAGPYIAMTFDDGPSATLTPKLLDLLAAHHIKATFFVIGENVAEHREIVERAAREGHEIANHSWSHPNFGKMSDEGVRRQLTRTDDAIKNATGVRPTLLRPPYGSITARQKRWIHDEFGYQIILWDVDPYDWKRPGPSVVCNRILKETRPGSIVLSHDIHPGTIEAMPSTFDQLQAKGFKFVTVSELTRMLVSQPPQPSTGTHVSVPATVAPSSSTSTIPSAESSPSH
ncbi:MAG: polysaccharide deacetylase family protein [Verrucomicrobia bacterium]|nr:MAG: polysaccharide deacetylase family protein [Verrucomicrobiota bacterium]